MLHTLPKCNPDCFVPLTHIKKIVQISIWLNIDQLAVPKLSVKIINEEAEFVGDWIFCFFFNGG